MQHITSNYMQYTQSTDAFHINYYHLRGNTSVCECVGHFGDDFHRPDDQTNNVKASKNQLVVKDQA